MNNQQYSTVHVQTALSCTVVSTVVFKLYSKHINCTVQQKLT